MKLMADYTREQALEDGVLVDATDIARDVGLPWPVFMSTALWNHFSIKGNESNLRELIGWADLSRHNDYEKDKDGYLTFGVWFGGPMVDVRVFVACRGGGVIDTLTLLLEEEDFDLRCPRSASTSFYTM